jgi:hypothetical protein
VNVDSTGGIASVYNLRLSGKWGFILKLRDIYGADGMKKVIRAGGELLERYRMRRGTFDVDAYAGLRTDFAGNHIADK